MTEREVAFGGLVQRLREGRRQFLQADSLRARFARGAFWSIVGAGISQGLGLLAGIIVARLLGREGFGELGIIQRTVGMFGIFAGIGIGMTAVKHVAELRARDPERAGRMIGFCEVTALCFSALVALGVLLAAPLLAEKVMNRPNLVFEVRLSCLLLFFSALNGAQTGALSGLEAFRRMALANLYRGVLKFPLMVGGVHLWGLSGAVLGFVASELVSCVIFQIALRQECGRTGIAVRYDGLSNLLPTLWRFSLPAFLSGTMIKPVEWVLEAMLAHQADGYVQLGLYNAALQYYIMILYLPQIVSKVTMPMLANIWAMGEYQQYRRFMFRNSLVLLGVVAPLALPLMLLAPWAMRVYGPEFAEGSWVLVLVCIRCLFIGPNIVVGQAIWSTGAARLGVILAGVRAVMLVALFAGLQRFGAVGLTATLAAAEGLLMVIQYVYMRFKIARMDEMKTVPAIPAGVHP